MRFNEFQSQDLIKRTIVKAWLLRSGIFRTPCCSHYNVQVGFNSHRRIMHDHLKLDSAVSCMQCMFRSTSKMLSKLNVHVRTALAFQGHVVIPKLDDCAFGALLIYNCTTLLWSGLYQYLNARLHWIHRIWTWSSAAALLPKNYSKMNNTGSQA